MTTLSAVEQACDEQVADYDIDAVVISSRPRHQDNRGNAVTTALASWSTILTLADLTQDDVDAMVRDGMSAHEVAERLRALSGLTVPIEVVREHVAGAAA